jgi:WD40 repeat protein
LKLLKETHGLILEMAWSPDGKRLATGGATDILEVWDVNTGKLMLALSDPDWNILVPRSPTKKTNGWGIAWSPDGKRLATGSYVGTAKVWDAANGKELLTLGRNSYPIPSVAWSPDGRRLATASGDKTAKVWEIGIGP